MSDHLLISILAAGNSRRLGQPKHLVRLSGEPLIRRQSRIAVEAKCGDVVVILGAALLGGPVSTTQVVGTAIMGAGSAERISKVRWGLIQRIGLSWLLTIPLSALLAGVLYLVMIRVLG